ncbi:MAG: hypothetical protein EBZ93_11550, partial [Actinobacteria bacterium]|nr:hypothetical protein [Actinomycetota bacterium]
SPESGGADHLMSEGGRTRRPRATLSHREALRAIFIDFEGTEKDPASFLGYWCDGTWEVALLESGLEAAAHYPHRLGSLHVSTSVEVCRRLQERAVREDRRIVAWSSRELTEILTIDDLTTDEKNWWEANLFNALPPAKAWARRTGTEIPTIPGKRGKELNKWSLSGFRKATGYPDLAALFEPGTTASRIRYVRSQLAKRGEFTALTPVAKRKWVNVLTHNFHDCAGLAHVVSTVFADILPVQNSNRPS